MLDAGVDGYADVGLGDDRGPLGPDGEDLEEAVTGPGPHQHVVGLVGHRDRDADHRSISSSTRAATSSRSRSSTSMTTSDTSS